MCVCDVSVRTPKMDLEICILISVITDGYNETFLRIIETRSGWMDF